MSFEEACVNLGIKPVTISFKTTSSVKRELKQIAEENDVELETFMRMLVDDFLIMQID